MDYPSNKQNINRFIRITIECIYNLYYLESC